MNQRKKILLQCDKYLTFHFYDLRGDGKNIAVTVLQVFFNVFRLRAHLRVRSSNQFKNKNFFEYCVSH